MAKLWAPRRFSKLSRFSCFSSLSEGRFPAEPDPPALDLDVERAPRPFLDGDDRNAVKVVDVYLDFHSKREDVPKILQKKIKYSLIGIVVIKHKKQPKYMSRAHL